MVTSEQYFNTYFKWSLATPMQMIHNLNYQWYNCTGLMEIRENLYSSVCRTVSWKYNRGGTSGHLDTVFSVFSSVFMHKAEVVYNFQTANATIRDLTNIF
jgi:hypothetical protein